MPFAPKLIAAVFEVPMLIAPLAEVPVPARMLTEPPVEVPPDSLPPLMLIAPPVPEAVVFTAGWSVKALPPVSVVISGLKPPAKASWPSCLTVRVLTPPSWLTKFKELAAFKLLTTNALAVPELAMVKFVAVPESDASS
jgi:hypothetical protein